MFASGDRILDESIRIDFAEYGAYEISIAKDDTTVTVGITVTDGNDISIALMTPDNYQLYIDGNTVDALMARNDIVSGTYSVTVDAGSYYLALDNTDSLTGVTVAVTIDTAVPPSDISSGSPNIDIIAYVIGIVVIGVVIYLIVDNSKKKSRPPQYPPQGYQQPPMQQGPYCRNCNISYQPGTQFCNGCGAQL